MTFKTTFRLFIGVCLLGGVLFIVDYQARVRQVRRTENQKVFDLSTEPVVGISITRDGTRIECLKKGNDWFLNAPVRARGNAAVIERIVAVLETAEWKDRITASQRESRELQLSDYGLAPAQITIAVDTPSRREILFLGDDIPLGDGLYARHSLSDAVLTVPRAVVEALPASITPLRDRAILHGTPEKTVRLEIQRPESGFVQLVREGHVWMIQQPFSARADAALVHQILDALYALRVETFFWDAEMSQPPPSQGTPGTLEMAASASIESCGLATDVAQVRVTVWVEGDSLGQALLLGKPAPDREGEIYAKRGEIDAIYTVSNAVLSVCACEVRALRDRAVFPVAEDEVGRIVLIADEAKLVLVRAGTEAAWRVEEPVQWGADPLGVRELVDRLSSLTIQAHLDEPGGTLEELGLAPAQYTIMLSGFPLAAPDDSRVDVEAIAGGGEFLIGNFKPGSEARFAKRVGSDDVFLISGVGLEWLGVECVNPLLYRDRTMLALSPSHIRRITVANAAGEQGVERDAEDVWSCVGTAPEVPALDVIQKILFAVANVRAARVEVHNPKSLEPYGLKPPVATVTFGLQGEGGIQKSLLIGAPADAGLVYATVRGQDVVFLVSDRLSALLLQPLCVPPSDPPDTQPVISGEGD